MSLPRDASLSLDQAPPLGIPVSFFVTGPVSVAVAGLLLLFGVVDWSQPFTPGVIALTHLATLGFLGPIMLGALYQMLPVVAGVPVPVPRLAHGVHALLLGGVGFSVAGLLLGWPTGMALGGGALTLAVLGFTVPAGVALLRAPADVTVWGMRLALLCLLAVAGLGVWMGRGHATGMFPGPRTTWTSVHLAVGLLGWVGTLIASVSWQVVPMFYLTHEVDRRVAWATLLGAGLGMSGLGVALFADVPGAAWAGLPAGLAVWVLHPASTLVAIRNRRRKRADGSLTFWKGGLSIGLLCGPAAVVALSMASPRAWMLFGWLAVWGWAGMIVHGMLGRILPFLVWFHWFSPLVGLKPVPPMRRILPDTWIQRAFWVHLASVGLGAVAILWGGELLARLSGLGLLAVAGALSAGMVKTLRARVPEA